MRVVGVVGWKNSGKTTLVTRLVAHLVADGLSVSTIKHAHHGFDVDQPGTDSGRHRAAGAREVLVASDRRFALMHEVEGAPPSLGTLLTRLAPVDLVVVEGFKSAVLPKIEVTREAAGRGGPLLAASDPNVRAIAADGPVPELPRPVRNFHLDDIDGIARFVADELFAPDRGGP